MRVGVVVFPGSNCDHDTQRVFGDVLGQDARFLWHKDADLRGAEAIVIPGGFSYGDYLRTGAIARFSPVMASVKAFAEQGGRVLGICNGFQILQEAGVLAKHIAEHALRVVVAVAAGKNDDADSHQPTRSILKLSITGFESTVRAISSACFLASSSVMPSKLSRNDLPWRRSVMAAKPRPCSASSVVRP